MKGLIGFALTSALTCFSPATAENEGCGSFRQAQSFIAALGHQIQFLNATAIVFTAFSEEN
jgi:hypothetical protein